jgi:hypothetical protein
MHKPGFQTVDVNVLFNSANIDLVVQIGISHAQK